MENISFSVFLRIIQQLLTIKYQEINMLAVRDVQKSYGNKTVLKGISFTAPKGQIISLLGNNGSGKTTTFRCIMGLSDCDKGSIRYNGRPIERKRFGYLPEERSLFYDVPVFTQLKLLGQLKGADSEEASLTADYWITRMKIEEYRNQIPLRMSKGNQQKVQLIICLMGKPDILILDEPWTGLDQNNIGIFRDVLTELKTKNKIILLSSHQYQPVQEICDRYLYLKNGELVINETKAHLLEMPQRIVEIEHDGRFIYQGKEAVRTTVHGRIVKLWVSNDETAWAVMEKTRNDSSVISARKRKLTINDLIEVSK
ncbi:MAG: ATP-binding cassette domain-containing protein [Erysipelotrichaceae bacterium]|nr:ATP-binding cassette domain-containing protein [Erysipelotrichaceae bacterium]